MEILYEEAYSAQFTEQRKMDIIKPDRPNGSCLLFIHGGGWSAGKKEQWHKVAEHFAGLGYVCASAGPGQHLPGPARGCSPGDAVHEAAGRPVRLPAGCRRRRRLIGRGKLGGDARHRIR